MRCYQRRQLAALTKWHNDQGFPDSTKAPLVKSILKGIRRLHPTVEKQAKPLQLERLEIVDTWLHYQAKYSEIDAVAGFLGGALVAMNCTACESNR